MTLRLIGTRHVSALVNSRSCTCSSKLFEATQDALSTRTLMTSSSDYGKRNFRKFELGNKRGTRIYKERRKQGDYADIPFETKVKPTGYFFGDKYVHVPEMVPEFIVPDLTGCALKPYVSYRAKDVYQSEFTPKDLFDAVYKSKIENDFKEGKLDEKGNPLNPSEEESLDREQAWIRARKTGSDIFSERIPKPWECLDLDTTKNK